MSQKSVYYTGLLNVDINMIVLCVWAAKQFIDYTVALCDVINICNS